MKLEVKVPYAVLKDRLKLSLSKGWIDDDGAIYLVYSNSKLMALLGCSKSKLLTIKKTSREYGLIDEVQQSSSEKGRMAIRFIWGSWNMNLPQSQIQMGVVFKKTRGGQNQPGPVLNSATRETEVSETDVSEIKESESVIEDEEEKVSLIGSWKYLSRFSILINRQNTNFKEIFPWNKQNQSIDWSKNIILKLKQSVD